MVEKRITRKVISSLNKNDTAERKVLKVSEVIEQERPVEEKAEGVVKPKKACFFCQSKTEPSHTDINTLRRFTTDRAKIVLRTKSNLCSRHQRAMTRQVKYARHLALLPFTPKV